MVEKNPMYHRLHLRYELRTPMRVGHRKVGNLQTTNLYVPGMAMWASTVNRLVRLLPHGCPKGQENPYLSWGRFLQQTCRFSCLFFEDPDSKTSLLPGISRDRQRLQDLLLSSSVHTPIEHTDMVREEGMLHELEWILPRSGQRGRTTLCGWLDIRAVREPADNDPLYWREADGRIELCCDSAGLPLEEIMARATVGADLNKGRGQLSLKKSEPERKPTDGMIRAEGKTPIQGQLLWQQGLECRGVLETIAGRCSLPLDGRNGGYRPGGYLYHHLVYVPGAVAEGGDFLPDWAGMYRKTGNRGQKRDEDDCSDPAGKHCEAQTPTTG